MQLSPEDEQFRDRLRRWLAENLTGRFAALRGRGGPGREHEAHDERLAWNRHLAAAGWTCLGWPAEHGGRGRHAGEQVIFHEEYARSGAPARVGYLGEGLLGPTMIAFGTAEQQRRFLPRDHGGRRAVVPGLLRARRRVGPGRAYATRAGPRGGEWVITGQKIWTSLAARGRLVLRAGPDASRARGGTRGLSYLLVPMRQPGVEVRPIRQLTGTSEFNEVFFDGARTRRDLRGRLARRRLAGGHGPPCGTSAAWLDPRPADRVPAGAGGGDRGGPADRRGRRPGAARPAGPGVDRARGHARARAAHAGRRDRRREPGPAAPRC